MNQARTPQDADIGQAVVAAWRKYFGLEMDYLGVIHYDDEMWRAVRARRPLLLERPDVPAARAFAAWRTGCSRSTARGRSRRSEAARRADPLRDPRGPGGRRAAAEIEAA